MASNQTHEFDILNDCDGDELEYGIDREEYNFNYRFDNTYNNIQGEAEEQEELMGTFSRIVIDEVMTTDEFYCLRISLFFFFKDI